MGDIGDKLLSRVVQNLEPSNQLIECFRKMDCFQKCIFMQIVFLIALRHILNRLCNPVQRTRNIETDQDAHHNQYNKCRNNDNIQRLPQIVLIIHNIVCGNTCQHNSDNLLGGSSLNR